jgi:hypothetical protein
MPVMLAGWIDAARCTIDGIPDAWCKKGRAGGRAYYPAFPLAVSCFKILETTVAVLGGFL